MKILCPAGVHEGVFQSLDASLCSHQFYLEHWRYHIKSHKPTNFFEISHEEALRYDNFDAILVHDINDYNKISHIKKPIIFYQLISARGWNFKSIYANPYVIPIWGYTTIKASYGVSDGLHKTLPYGIDGSFWSGWNIDNSSKKIVYVKNEYKKQNQLKYDMFKYVTSDYPTMLIGKDGDIITDENGVKNNYLNSRIYVNIEPSLSTMSVSMLEAMSTGLPIVCNDSEGCGEIVRNGFNGFISNSNAYLKKRIDDLMNDDELAKKVGANGRETVKLLFSKEICNSNWQDFLDNLNLYNRTTWRAND